jgi:hypothetical protein
MADSTITLRTRADLAGARQTSAAFDRLERDFAALQNSEIRAAAATGQYARALGLISSEMSVAGAGSVRYNQLLVQQAGVQRQLAAETARAEKAIQAQSNAMRAAQRSAQQFEQTLARAANQARAAAQPLPDATQNATRFAGALGGISSAAGALGLVVVAERIARFGNEAREASLSLQRTEALTREIAGSQAKYNEILSAARSQQSLFGGTLQENIEQLSGFAVQARLSGANLQDLINVAQRLATLDPGQGIAGASIALREALSGDVTSLARRFEIPRVELAKLRDESTTAAERLRIVSDFLTKAGISADVASKTTSDTARTYNELGAALDSTKTKVGALIAEMGKRPANFLANAIQALIISTPGEIARKLDEVRVNVVATSQSYDDYVGNLKRVNEQLRGVTDPIAGISRAQFDYAKALQASGVNAEEAAAKAQKYATVVDAAKQASGDWLGTNTALRDRLISLAETTDGNAAAVQNLSANINNIGIDRFLAAIGLLEEQQRRATLATQENEREQRRLSLSFLDGVPPIDKHNQALAEQITKAQGAKVEAEQLGAMQRNLAAIGDAVRKGHITAADGADFLAKQYRITQGEARELLRLQGLVANVSLDPNSGTPQAGGDALNRFLTQGQKAQQFATTQAAAAKEAQSAQILALGTDKQKLSVLQQQYNQAVRIQGANSAAAIQARTALEQEKRRQAEAGKRGATSSNKGLGASDRTDLSLAQAGLEGVDRLQARLDEVNKKLESGRLTEQARKQLTVEKLELERKIGDALDKQRDAALDAQILAIKDRQERRQEQRRLEGARRRQASGEFSEREKLDAADVAELIPLEQEKRRREIAAKAREGGVSVNLPPTPVLGAAAPGGQAPTLPGQAPTPAQATTQPILIIMDGKQVAEIILPYQIAGLRSGRAQVQAAGG